MVVEGDLPQPEPAPRPEFLEHVHAFRGLAILAILAAHCISVFRWKENPALECGVEVLFKNSSVFFIFITGYLLQHLSPRFQAGAYFRNRLSCVGLPYLVMSIPALVLSTWFVRQHDVGEWFYALPAWQRIAGFLLNGDHLAPFWYIPFAFCLYAAAPLLLAADRRPRLYWGLAGLFCLSWLVPRTDWAMLNVLHFLSVFVSGMAASRFHAPLKTALDALRLPLWGCWLFLVCLEWGPQDRDGFTNLLQKSLLAVLLLDLLERCKGFRRPFMGLAEVSFGLYFVHGYLIAAAKLLLHHPDVLRASPLLSSLLHGSIAGFVLVWLVVLGASLGAVLLGRRLLGSKSKYILGC